MPRRKNKIIYLDTCVILDYLDKEENSVVLMKSVKDRKWEIRTSTFGMVELAEYRRNEIYLWHKLSNKKSLNTLMKAIRNPQREKKLKDYQFSELSDWLANIHTALPKFQSLDLTSSEKPDVQSSWQLAYDLSISTNLNAKDNVHLATAISASLNKECDFFITIDGNLYDEAKRIVTEFKMKKKLQIIKPKEFIERYPPLKK